MVAVKNAETTREVIEFAQLPPRDEIAAHHLMDEQRLLDRLIERAVFSEDERRRSTDLARRLVHAARADRGKHAGVDAFMREYGLSSEEGVILMCLAEALLRIPDTETADALIAEKISGGHWEKHLRPFRQPVRQRLDLGADADRAASSSSARGTRRQSIDALKRLVARSGEPVIRQAVRQAVTMLGDQFVLGRTIREALDARQGLRGARLSLLLRHAGRGGANAEGRRRLLRALSWRPSTPSARRPARSARCTPTRSTRGPGLSVKLSALHPRFEPGKEERLAAELRPALLTLARAARSRGLTLTVDAEEQDRLDPTLRAVRRKPSPIRARQLERAWHRRAGLRQARHPGACAGCAASPSAPASAFPCASSKAPTGTARSNGRRSARSPTIRCSRASCTRTCRTSPACG